MLTLSKTKGTGGTVKGAPEDFIVKEITSKGRMINLNEKYTAAILGEEEVPDGKFTTFVMQKNNWDTVGALIRLSKITGHGKKSISYAGTKDKQSISVQLAAIYGITPERILGARLKDVSINGAWKSNGVELGSNMGNGFEVMIRQCKTTKTLKETLEELDGKAPNYFDRQRFGMRLNNVAVGLKIMKGDFEGAAMEFLGNSKLEINEDAIAARKKLSEERDFKDAVQYFPKYLKNERSVIEYMSEYDNYANALRKLPRGVLIMFIHSVQSLIFNASLEARIKDEDFKASLYCAKNTYGFPDLEKISEKGEFALGNIVGFETKPDALHEEEKDILEKLDIKTEEFKIKPMPELSMKRSFMTLFTSLKDLSYKADDKDIKLKFSIPSGSYATIFLNEITKSDDLKISDMAKLK